ncbi:hypothetical protein BJV78DRAFT_1357084 [Lactifluus subvellereus]|nr:hypothetical protein BJV78DRAFT_1357084 [Lactifluus subvellereus]
MYAHCVEVQCEEGMQDLTMNPAVKSWKPATIFAGSKSVKPPLDLQHHASYSEHSPIRRCQTWRDNVVRQYGLGAARSVMLPTLAGTGLNAHETRRPWMASKSGHARERFFLDSRRVDIDTSVVVDRSRGEGLTVHLNVTQESRAICCQLVKTRLPAAGTAVPDSQIGELHNDIDKSNE